MRSPNRLLTHSGTLSGRCVTMLNLKVVFFLLRDSGPKVVNISKPKQNSWLISENTTYSNSRKPSSRHSQQHSMYLSSNRWGCKGSQKFWQRARERDVKPWKSIHICQLYRVTLNALCLINTTKEIASYFLYRLLICLSLPAGIVCLLQTSDQDLFLIV